MKAPTLYLDTSVIGGYYDAEWMQDTRELWRQAKEGNWKMVTSVITERELLAAPVAHCRPGAGAGGTGRPRPGSR